MAPIGKAFVLLFFLLQPVLTGRVLAQEPDVKELTIARVHQALARAEFTCVALVDAYLQRIKRYDQSSKLNAIVLINPRARDKASDLDKHYAKQGSVGPLHCVPVILKDNFDTADMPTSGGSKVLADSLPPDDAFMVRALRNAGAIILAKSNMAEWAFSPYFTISSTAGETRNPYDLERVPAGSSGGTAAAIAANFGLVGMGTDTGNSIRGPASHAALVGLRSTLGATSRDGVIPLLLNRDIAGPMTRTVEDLAKVFSVVSAFDANDPLMVKGRGRLPASFAGFLNKQGLQGKRIGVLRALVDTETADHEIQDLFADALKVVKSQGATVVDPVKIPGFQALTKATGFCSRFRYDINNYFKSLGNRAPVKRLLEVVQAKRYHPSSEGGIKWAMSVDVEVTPQQQSIPCVGVEGDPRRKALLEAVIKTMDQYKLDALAYPTWNNPPRALGDLDSPHGNNSPVIAPHSGQPAITVPMGFTSEGLPAGLQLLARPYGDALLIEMAFAYEQATLHRKAPAGFE